MKEHLQNLQRLRSGTYRDTSKGLFLDRNERTVPFDDETIKSLSKRLARLQFNLYPELDPFYITLSNWLKISKDCIFVTEGVSGAIKSIMETLTEPGDNIVFPTPTFALYPVYGQMFRVESRNVEYKIDYQLNIKQLLKLIDNKTSIVFLPNPNMPIEGTLDLDMIRDIAEKCAKNETYLVIDEVYFLFGGPTSIELIKDYENLILMRSFSKAFGLAGTRVGYLIGSEKLVEYVSKTRTGYETNSVSMEIVSFFLENIIVVEKYIKNVKEGIFFLKGELDKLGLEYNGGNHTNFLYVSLKDKKLVSNIVEILAKKQIYIRGNWPPPFENGVTISGGPKRILEKFVFEFSKAITEFN